MEDMKQIEMHRRPNIGVDKMSEYENGGLCIESQERNGVLVYVPYGIWCDLFKATEISTNMMNARITELKRLIADAETTKFAGYESFVQNFKEQIETLQHQINIFEAIAPMCDEI